MQVDELLRPFPIKEFHPFPRALPDYAEYCSRVRVVRDLTGLESAATDLAVEFVGR